MSRSDRSRAPHSVLVAVFRPAGAVYLMFCLAGLAAGLWPEALFVPRGQAGGAPLPTLRTLAVAQISFGLLVYPLVVLRRTEHGTAGRYWPGAVAEMCVYFVVAVPFYFAAAYLADAVWTDAVRTAVYVACVWTFCLAAGAHLAAGRPGRCVVMLVAAVAALGLPAAHYIALEFATSASGAFLGRLSPATCAWQVARSRGPGWHPKPLWAAAVWPAAALVLICLAALARPRHPSPGPSGTGIPAGTESPS